MVVGCLLRCFMNYYLLRWWNEKSKLKYSTNVEELRLFVVVLVVVAYTSVHNAVPRRYDVLPAPYHAYCQSLALLSSFPNLFSLHISSHSKKGPPLVNANQHVTSAP